LRGRERERERERESMLAYLRPLPREILLCSINIPYISYLTTPHSDEWKPQD
jgi:hypothetical protein